MDPESPPGGNNSRVHIFGQTLTIKGSADPAYLQNLAGFVTAHMERLSRDSPLTPVPQVAMLAALNISHELFELRRRVEAREAEVDRRTRDLLDSIDAEFHAAGPHR
ncbi:MAG: cell division protein ZapA [Nitrospirota bacterium]|nr:cell division protein ZapA [Nitrospirota bacterium]